MGWPGARWQRAGGLGVEEERPSAIVMALGRWLMGAWGLCASMRCVRHHTVLIL